ncbi:hypothetical protein DPEC_G00050440, partial [Dallia pectoralis]
LTRISFITRGYFQPCGICSWCGSISLTPSYFLGAVSLGSLQSTPVAAAGTTTTAKCSILSQGLLYLFLFNVIINVTLVFL